jgi:hypothetical protein
MDGPYRLGIVGQAEGATGRRGLWQRKNWSMDTCRLRIEEQAIDPVTEKGSD